MNLPNKLRPLLITLLLGCTTPLSAADAEPASTPNPSASLRENVLFVAVDDLNDWVNCIGGRAGVHTPNIDRLAKRGVLFPNAHCSAPSCNPSRVSPSTSGDREKVADVMSNYQ